MEKGIKTSSTVETQSNGDNSGLSRRVRTLGHLAIVALFYLIAYTIFFLI
jgi:hypothetical protein